MTSLQEATGGALAFAAALRPSDGPSWLQAIRQKATEELSGLEFPTKKNEAWRYTNIKSLADTTFAPTTDSNKSGIVNKPIPGSIELCFVNGFYRADLSSISELPEGLEIKPLSRAIVENADEVQAAMEDAGTSFFNLLNLATAQEGAFVKVSRKSVIKPLIHLNFINATDKDENLAFTPFNVISVGELAEAEILEEYHSREESGVYFNNTQTVVKVAKAAQLKHYRSQAEAENAYHVADLSTAIDRDALYKSVSFASGSKISRNEMTLSLNGENSEVHADGLYLSRDAQLMDSHTEIRHMVPRAVSHQLFKGILSGRSRGVFNGKVYIAEGAEQTDSTQLNKNVLISRQARIDTKPELEVYNDDVKAAHGATIGQLSEEELFYLQSRCISKADAQRILVHGFMDEILYKVSNKLCRKRLSESIDEFFELIKDTMND